MAPKTSSAKFKAEVALAAVRGDLTVPEISKKYGMHPTQINNWKASLINESETLFVRNKAHENSDEKVVAELERKIGQLKKNNFFIKFAYTCELLELN